jgi:adenylate kinase
MGPPGSGKGTQAIRISKKYGIPAISTGQILRDEVRLNSALGQKIQQTIESGMFVSDDLMIELIQQRLHQSDCAEGFILDGFPRTLSQAHALTYSNININYVFYLEIDDALLIQRLSARWTHEASGRTYHLINNPPKHPGLDDVTGEVLIQRADDRPENIKTRLEYFHELTAPVMNYYQDAALALNLEFHRFSADRPVESLTQSFFHVLG